MKNRFLTYIFILLSTSAFSQFSIDSILQSYEDMDLDKQLIEVVKIDNPVYKPIISAGAGIFNYYGELNKDNKDFTSGRIGYNLDIYRTMNPHYKFGFRFIYGQVYGNRTDKTTNKNFNFESDMYAFGVNVNYNIVELDFANFDKEFSFSPYISLGVEFLNFEPMGDLYNEIDSSYHYWSDGSIRLVPEEIGDGTEKEVLRDNNYETSLRDENIDKLDNPNPVAIGFPIDVGFDFVLGQKASCRVGYSYHFTLNDGIDNITTKGTNYDENPERKGDKRNDRFSYTYVSFSLDLFSRTTEEKQLQFLDLGVGGVFDFWDMDGDFVMDVYDECPWTPFRERVDTVGCPLDDDKDKIPNFEDTEAKTPQNAFYVNKSGKEVKEEDLLAMLNDARSLPQEEIYRHYPSLLEGTGLYKRFYKKIPEKFKRIDSDEDNFISLDELLDAIDKFFDSGSELTVDELYELNEFFFIQ